MLDVEIKPGFGEGVLYVTYDLLLNGSLVMTYVFVHQVVQNIFCKTLFHEVFVRRRHP